MRKISKLAVITLFMTPSLTLAQSAGDCPNPPCRELLPLITQISNTILAVIGVIAVLFIIIGGFQYVASAGNPESIGKAKSTIMYAVIGLIVALLAWAIVNFIVTKI